MISIGINIGEARDKAFENIDEEFSKNFKTKIKINKYGKYMFENSTFTTLPFCPIELNEGTYQNCKNITNLDSLPSNLKSIGDYCFCGCTGLTEITIPASVTYIGKGAFMNCTNLETITFENRNTSLIIDEKAFFGCYKVENIVINTTADLTIGNNAFTYMAYKDSGLKRLELNCEGKLTLRGNCCSSCSNLTSIINIAESSSLDIDLAIFQELTALTYVNLLTSGDLKIKFTRYPNGYMPENNFDNLTGFNIATVKLNGLSLDESTLEDTKTMLKLLLSSSKLNKLSLNNEIIELNCISSSNKSNEIYIYGTQQENELKNFSAFNSLKTVKLLSDDNRTYLIKTDCFKDINSLERIIEGSINEANYPSSSMFYICDLVTSIDQRAFDNAIKDRNIDTIRLPFFASTISRGNSLKDIFDVIPDTVTTIICSRQTNIPYRAIYNQHNITDVYLPQDVISIGSEAFNRNNEAPIQLRVYGGSATTNHRLDGIKELGEDVFTYGIQKEKNDINYPYNSTIFLYGNTASVTIPDNTRLIAKHAIKNTVTTLKTPLLNHRKEDKDNDEDEKFTPGTTTQISYICEDISKLQNLYFTQDITIYRDKTYKPFQGISTLNTLEFNGAITDSGPLGQCLSFNDKLSITNLKFNKNIPYQFLSKEEDYVYNVTNLILDSGVDIIEENAFTGLSNTLKTVKVIGAENTSIKFGANAFDISNCVLDEVEYGLTLKEWLTQNEFKSLTSNPIRLTYKFKTSDCSDVYKIDNTILGISNPTAETETVVIKPYALADNKFLNEVDVTFLDVNYTVGEEAYNPAQAMPLQGYALIDVYSDESLKSGGAERANKLIGNAQLRKNYKEEYSSFITKDTGGEE